MANKFILIVDRQRNVVAKVLRKPPAPRSLSKWVKVAKDTARSWGVYYFAFRYLGQWHVFEASDIVGDALAKTFPADAPKDAVEMYLLMKEPPRA